MMNKCKCNCGSFTNGIWKTGHNLRLNPLPGNLGEFIKGKKGKENPFWKGGTKISNGYKYIHKPNHKNCSKLGYVAEHRLKMEDKIGRILKTTESIHHIDEDKLNNKIENLVLIKNQAEHNKFHIRLRDRFGRFLPGGDSTYD